MTTTLVFCQFTCKQRDPYKEKEIIPWNDTIKLTWDNFKGKPKEWGNKAITCSTIYSKYESSDIPDLKINVRACFIKKESWKKDKCPSDYHLNHEQKHFDIAEIYARKLRRLLADTVFKSKMVAKKEIPKIIRNNNKSFNEFQELYDKETNHSINKEQQVLWDAKIENELTVLRNYTNNIVDIKVK